MQMKGTVRRNKLKRTVYTNFNHSTVLPLTDFYAIKRK